MGPGHGRYNSGNSPLKIDPQFTPHTPKQGKWGWFSGRAPDAWSKGSNSGRSGRRIFFSRVSFLCWCLFWFHPHVTTEARKRSWSFCEKCRWQVTAKHTCIHCLWLRMKWQSKVVPGCMVYTEHAPRWLQFHVASSMSQPNNDVSTPLRWMFKNAL